MADTFWALVRTTALQQQDPEVLRRFFHDRFIAAVQAQGGTDADYHGCTPIGDADQSGIRFFRLVGTAVQPASVRD